MEDPLMLSGLPTPVEAESASKKKDVHKQTAALNAHTAAQREERIATGKSSKAPSSASSAPPPPPPPEVDKSALLDRIGQYKERFPQLKSRNKLSAKSSVAEIEDEMHFIEQQLAGGGNGGGGMGMQVLIGAMTGLETITRDYFNPLNMNLSGLGAVTRDNKDQFQDVVDELMIKYGTNMHMGPEMRLALSIGTMMYTVHAANSGDPRVAEVIKKMSRPSDPDL
tara:strand:- start:3496 stop:4167 length:672 start_codon:yes stop_codon:yes gene_type:complete